MSRLFILISLFTLLVCNACNTGLTHNVNTDATGTGRLDVNQHEYNSKQDEFTYSNSTDSICEEIQLKVLSRDRTLDSIPTKIAFVITLRSPQKNTKFQIKGIAQLTSSNESFLDSNKPGATPYWAADYNKNDTQYTLNIRLDVENYEACALSIRSNISNQLSSYLTYLPKYPKATVLKLGRCR